MTAKEMFEELGYVQIIHKNTIEYYQEYMEFNCNCCSWKRVRFDLDIEKFFADEDYESMYMDVGTFKAIHQQMIELGWLDA